MDERRRERGVSIGLLVLRLGVAGYLLTHGRGKLEMLLAGQFEQFGDPVGLGSEASLVLITVAEFLCSLLVILGLGTRFAAAVIVVGMAVAAFVAHAQDPWTMEQGYKLWVSGAAQSWASREPALLYLIPALALVFTGAGRYALDALLGRRRRGARIRIPPIAGS